MKSYSSIDGIFYLTYFRGVILDIVVNTDDIVLFDGLKHRIAFYEDQLDREYFK